jgi:hypothetical protein
MIEREENAQGRNTFCTFRLAGIGDKAFLNSNRTTPHSETNVFMNHYSMSQFWDENHLMDRSIEM